MKISFKIMNFSILLYLPVLLYYIYLDFGGENVKKDQ